MRTVLRWLGRHSLPAAMLALLAVPGLAFMETFEPIEMARAADIILVGKVVELKAQTILMMVEKTIKGDPKATEIEVFWDQRTGWELMPAAYEKDERLLAFLKPKENIYEPLRGSVGTLDLRTKGTEGYPGIVQKILDFDSATSTDVRKAVLLELLGNAEKPSRLTALSLLGREYKKLAPVLKSLEEQVSELARDSDPQVAGNAVQVLGAAGGKSSMPLLIELLGHSSPHVSEAAFGALKRRTGGKIEVDTRQPPEARKRSIKDWQDWWGKNRDKIQLRP